MRRKYSRLHNEEFHNAYVDVVPSTKMKPNVKSILLFYFKECSIVPLHNSNIGFQGSNRNQTLSFQEHKYFICITRLEMNLMLDYKPKVKMKFSYKVQMILSIIRHLHSIKENIKWLIIISTIIPITIFLQCNLRLLRIQYQTIFYYFYDFLRGK